MLRAYKFKKLEFGKKQTKIYSQNKNCNRLKKIPYFSILKLSHSYALEKKRKDKSEEETEMCKIKETDIKVSHIQNHIRHKKCIDRWMEKSIFMHGIAHPLKNNNSNKIKRRSIYK